MSDAIWLALIVAVPAMASPLLMAWLTNRNRRLEKREDYARQDAVAAKAAEVAKQLLDRQEEVKKATEEAARLLLENQRQVAEQAEATSKEIKVLTGMLDGNFTKLMEDNRAALSHGLVLSRQLLAMTHEAGHETDPESLAEIKASEDRIAELDVAIAKRKHSDAVMKLQSALPSGPVPVTDDRTAIAAERSATALERAADAAEEKNQ